MLDRLQARADNAYCDYIGLCRRDECLGWEAKVERQIFGEAELKAHKDAAEKLGRHRALQEAASLLHELLTPNTTNDRAGTGPVHEFERQISRPAPCARHCEAQAFKIEIRALERQIADLQKEREAVAAAVPDLLAAFPLFDEEGLDEDEHCCEWSLQQDRKRLHAMPKNKLKDSK